MELLLSSAFDLLSSPDFNQVGRGVRHLEGIFAKLCLPGARPSGESVSSLSASSQEKPADPAYLEFLKLQDGFEWNVASEVLHILMRAREREDDDLVLGLVNLLQGVLLMHSPSRRLFSRTGNMIALLDLLQPGGSSSVHIATLLTLVSAMLDHPRNTRKFESLNGLAILTGLFHDRDTEQDVKVKITEFLYFYEMPEPKPKVPAGSSTGSGAGLVEEWEKYSKSAEEKQAMLRKFLPAFEGMDDDLGSRLSL